MDFLVADSLWGLLFLGVSAWHAWVHLQFDNKIGMAVLTPVLQRRLKERPSQRARSDCTWGAGWTLRTDVAACSGLWPRLALHVA